MGSGDKSRYFSLYTIEELIGNFKTAKQERDKYLRTLYNLDQYLNNIRLVIKTRLDDSNGSIITGNKDTVREDERPDSEKVIFLAKATIRNGLTTLARSSRRKLERSIRK